MHLASCRVRHYRSIADSGLVEFDPEITCIVGATGSGKTSFLKMLSGVSADVQFGEGDLPRNSEVLAGFRGGKVEAGGIVQLEAAFEVEDADVPRLPPEYRHARRITVRRDFDGRIAIAADGAWVPRADIADEAGQMLACAGRIAGHLHEQDPDEPSGGYGGSPVRPIDDAVGSFAETDFYSRESTMLAVHSLKAAAHSAPRPRPVAARLEEEFARMEAVRSSMERRIASDPPSELYRSIPKPRYCDRPFKLEDEVDLDRFIRNPYSSRTFLCVAQICGLAPAGLARARNAKAPERDAYLEARSATLSSRLRRLWRQESYTFRLAMDGRRLVLRVRDEATGATTPLTERSDGFRWQAAFFLGVLASLASGPGRSIVLLDNPATELHEREKGDVLRLVQEAAKSGRIQVVYSTHERGLIDPWRIDRIRVAHLTGKGTRVKTVSAAASDGMLEATMKGIGSPARYSLFGAPRTVSFEGASEMYIAAAANEYLARTNPDAALDKDTYSIDSVEGTEMARHAWQVYRGLGLDFAIVVGRGGRSTGLARDLGQEEFERRFVELPPVPGKRETGIEDLVDGALYYEAFERTCRHILDAVPDIGEIDGDGGQRRSVNYSRWLERSGKPIDRALVAQRMFDVMLGDGPAGGAPGRAEALERTAAAFAGLFAEIKARFAGGSAGPSGQPSPCLDPD